MTLKRVRVTTMDFFNSLQRFDLSKDLTPYLFTTNQTGEVVVDGTAWIMPPKK
jgi:hypothetical protein